MTLRANLTILETMAIDLPSKSAVSRAGTVVRVIARAPHATTLGVLVVLGSMSSLGCSTVKHLEVNSEPVQVQQPESQAFGQGPVAPWTPVGAGKADWLRNREYPWVVDYWGLARAKSITTSWKHTADGSFSVHLYVSHGFTGTSLDLVFETRERDRVAMGGGRFFVLADAAEHSDAAAPRSWPNLTGSVLVSEDPWTWLETGATSDLLISFDLSDCSAATPDHLRGIVNLPKN